MYEGAEHACVAAIRCGEPCDADFIQPHAIGIGPPPYGQHDPFGRERLGTFVTFNCQRNAIRGRANVSIRNAAVKVAVAVI